MPCARENNRPAASTRWPIVEILIWFLLSAGTAHAAIAQAPASHRLGVETVETVGATKSPVAGADVTLLGEDGRLVLTHGITDGDGRTLLRVASGAKRSTIVVRKIGYKPARRIVGSVDADTSLLFVMEPQLSVLDAIKVQAEADRRHYTIGASEIDNTNRGPFDALIVLQKLRPQMLGDWLRLCEPTDKIWINGERVMFGTPPAPGYHIRDTILASIKGGHIAEMRYISCWDKPPEGLQRDALYIVLKPGVGWDWKHGSFVADSSH